MPTTDKRIDAYIAKSADFAKPILTHLRSLVHKACPDATETIKWGMPFFENSGSILCNMAAFKQHCSFGLWNAPLLKDPEGILQVKERNAMGHFDRITSMKDLPSDKIMTAYLKGSRLAERKGNKKTRREKRTQTSAAGALRVGDRAEKE